MKVFLKKILLLMFISAVGVTFLSCKGLTQDTTEDTTQNATDTTTDTTTPKKVSVTFTCTADKYYYESGSKTASITALWLSGDFNSWAEMDSAYAFKQVNGRWELTVEFDAGTKLTYKYQFNSPDGLDDPWWMTTMDGWAEYISPTPDSFASDGFSGKNAIYTVPAE